jgi:hypothetical protein
MSLEFAIKSDILNLQQRFAREIARNDATGRAHQVLISVSTSTASGSVIETVQNDRTNSADTFLFPSTTRFDNELQADTHLRRMAILFQLAAFVAAYQGDRDIVISATLQDAITDGEAFDYVAQCFVGTDGKLTTRELDIDDRSNR